MGIKVRQINLKQNNPLLSGDNKNFAFADKPDTIIWKYFKKGNEAAFIHIYNNYFKELLGFGYQITSNTGIIEDAIQDIFVDLRGRHASLPNLKVSIKAFLFKALKNKILAYCKRDQKQMMIADRFWETGFHVSKSIEDKIIHEERNKQIAIQLRHFVSSLARREREIIYYLYYEKLSYEEIKEVMNFDNVKSVRNLLYRSLSKLKLKFT